MAISPLPAPQPHTCRHLAVGMSHTLSVPSMEALSNQRQSELIWSAVMRSLKRVEGVEGVNGIKV